MRLLNTDRGFEYTENTYKALYGIFGKMADIEAGKKVDFSDEIAISPLRFHHLPRGVVGCY